jgi:hypothetical protein
VLDAAVFAAVAVLLGGTVAVTARDGRIVVLGLMLAAVAASLVASPLPDSLAVTARILGAMLAAYLLWAAAGSGSVESAGSVIGPLAEGAVAVAAFAVGLAVRPVDPLAGSAEAQAAGLSAQAAGISLIALAVVPLAGRDVFRMGVGVSLLTLGGSLVVGAWSGAPRPLEQLALAALLVGIAGATSLLIPSPEAVEEVEASAEGPDAWEVEPQPAAWPATEPWPTTPAGMAAAPAQAFQVIVKPGPGTIEASTDESRPTPPIEPERRPRPMTADPIEPDDWLAWGAPQTEPDRRPARKEAPKKPTNTRPDLGGKP